MERLKTREPVTLYYVDTAIDLSQEERAILTKYKLWPQVLFKLKYEREDIESIPDHVREVMGDTTETGVTIEEVFTKMPYSRHFYNRIPAGNFAHRMQNEILPALKTLITDTAAPLENRTFEL